jgi:hypothetical protein
MLTDASGKPIATTTFTVCVKGHVNEAPQHASVVFRDPVTGENEMTVLCARCQYDLFSLTCGALQMVPGTTRKEAEWKARELVNAAADMPLPEQRS